MTAICLFDMYGAIWLTIATATRSATLVTSLYRKRSIVNRIRVWNTVPYRQAWQETLPSPRMSWRGSLCASSSFHRRATSSSELDSAFGYDLLYSVEVSLWQLEQTEECCAPPFFWVKSAEVDLTDKWAWETFQETIKNGFCGWLWSVWIQFLLFRRPAWL